MKNWKKILLLVLIIGILIACGIIIYATKKPLTAKDSDPVASFYSGDFIDSLYNNTAFAAKFDGKNIAISGKIKEIIGEKLVIDAGGTSCLICTFDSSDIYNVNNTYEIGKPIVVKGIFYGYNKLDDKGMSLIPQDKTAYLKTCFINKKITSEP